MHKAAIAPSMKEVALNGTGRREAILRAAARLFAKNGYERTNTRSIAAAAGVAEGTIFRYFTTKKHLLLAFVERVALGSLPDCLDAARGLPAEETIRAFLLNRYELWQTHGGILKALFAEALFDRELAHSVCARITEPVTHLIEDYLARGLESGAFREMDLHVAARALVGHVFAPVMLFDEMMCAADERLTAERYAMQIARLFVEGISQKNEAA